MTFRLPVARIGRGRGFAPLRQSISTSRASDPRPHGWALCAESGSGHRPRRPAELAATRGARPGGPDGRAALGSARWSSTRQSWRDVLVATAGLPCSPARPCPDHRRGARRPGVARARRQLDGPRTRCRAPASRHRHPAAGAETATARRTADQRRLTGTVWVAAGGSRNQRRANAARGPDRRLVQRIRLPRWVAAASHPRSRGAALGCCLAAGAGGAHRSRVRAFRAR